MTVCHPRSVRKARRDVRVWIPPTLTAASFFANLNVPELAPVIVGDPSY
jgi:hypothetical protein